MVGCKKESRYRKSRKGIFRGKRKQDLGVSVVEEELGPSTSGLETASNSPGKLNRSFEKIHRNCPLLKEDTDRITTRGEAFKVGLFSNDDRNSSSARRAYGHKLVCINNLLESLAKIAVCKNCKNSKGLLQLWQEDNKRQGLVEKLFWKCANCEQIVSFFTSQNVQQNERGSAEVNIRLIQGGLETGNGLQSLSKLCCSLDLPPPLSINAFNNTMKKLQDAYHAEVQEALKKSAENLKKKLKDFDENFRNMNVKSDTFYASVSVDGTWQKRYGFSSLHGVVFIVAIETGEVLDYEVRSKVCYECRSRDKWDKDSQKYQQWFEHHKLQCSINHEKSAESMEKDAAVMMFLRSVELHGLKYTTYVGDGDSSAYAEVANAVFQKYGEQYLVLKEDCIGHIQKRMGAALRNFKNKNKGRKLSDGGSLGGRGRLTDAVIDSFQNYYGYAIRNNSNGIESMTKAVWAIYYHCIKNDGESLELQHRFCPKGESSWCKYQKDLLKRSNTYDQSRCLPSVFRNELRSIFERLSDRNLLQRCLKGLTQNQNESLNNVLWSKCPKRVFCGKRKLETAVCASILQWNVGAASAGNVLSRMGVKNIGINTLRGFRKANEARIKKAADKCKEKYRKRRQKLRQFRKQSTKSGKSYLSGSFSLYKVPDTKVKCSKVDGQATEELTIKFVDESTVSMITIEET